MFTLWLSAREDRSEGVGLGRGAGIVKCREGLWGSAAVFCSILIYAQIARLDVCHFSFFFCLGDKLSRKDVV